MAFFPILPGPGGEDLLTQNPFDFATANHVPVLIPILAPPVHPPMPAFAAPPPYLGQAAQVRGFANNLPAPNRQAFYDRVAHYYNLGKELSIHVANLGNVPVAVYVRDNPAGRVGNAEVGQLVWPNIRDFVWQA